MGAQKHVLKKQKNKFWKLPCLPPRKKFLESFQFAPIENPFNSKCGKKISRLPQQDKKNALTLKSSNKIMQLMFTKSTWLKHFSRFLFFVKFFVFMLMTFYYTNTQCLIFLPLYQCKIPIFSNIKYLKTFPFVKSIIRQGKFSEDIAIVHYCK